jgi:hypothetical protein
VEKTYHIARWVFGFIALFAINQLCLKVFQEKPLAWTAFLLSVLGGGAGWLQLLFNSAMLKSISPIDFWLIDAYVFFSISIFPAFSFTLALMAGALNLYLDYLKTGKWQTIVFISLLAVASQITNPIAFAVVDVSLAGATFILWWKNKKIELRHFYALSLIALAQIPLLGYNFIILQHDPVWSLFTIQNQTLSPPPIYYIWGFAPFWIFAIYGIILAFREQHLAMGTMALWVISGFVLAYFPFFIQRRFLFGITIPLGILAIYGLSRFIKFISIKLPDLLKREHLIYFAYISLASISFIYFILGMSLFMQTHPEGKFYPRDLENAIVWLDKNASPNDFLLADITTSQLAAQRTDLRVYVGHEIETLNFENKKSGMEAYFEGNSPENWLKQTKAQWVIYGPYEKKISNSFTPESEMELVYENKSVIIYKVKP